MIEFSDFQCPYCRMFANSILPELKSRYIDTGQLGYVFFSMPLERIHSQALNAARTAFCADQQRTFWEVHDWFFQDPRYLEPKASAALVARLEVDQARFARCFNDNSEAAVRQRINVAQGLEVIGTPTFFFGRRLSDGTVRVTKRVRGILSVAEAESVITEVR